jgi:hypothetical protein
MLIESWKNADLVVYGAEFPQPVESVDTVYTDLHRTN